MNLDDTQLDREGITYLAKPFTPDELKAVNFISLTNESPTGQQVRDYLDRIGVAEDPVVSTDNVETVKRMVQTGLGVALLRLELLNSQQAREHILGMRSRVAAGEQNQQRQGARSNPHVTDSP